VRMAFTVAAGAVAALFDRAHLQEVLEASEIRQADRVPGDAFKSHQPRNAATRPGVHPHRVRRERSAVKAAEEVGRLLVDHEPGVDHHPPMSAIDR